jgi:acetyl-CoA acetyltransferase
VRAASWSPSLRTVNQACLSGRQVILAAVRAVKLGEGRVRAGGRSMSRVPYILDAGACGTQGGRRPLHATASSIPPGQIMGETAERWRSYTAFPRQQDATAGSQTAERGKADSDEIVPVVKDGKTTVAVDTDDIRATA